jgi:DNA-directed RNA polymerase subunit L
LRAGILVLRIKAVCEYLEELLRVHFAVVVYVCNAEERGALLRRELELVTKKVTEFFLLYQTHAVGNALTKCMNESLHIAVPAWRLEHPLESLLLDSKPILLIRAHFGRLLPLSQLLSDKVAIKTRSFVSHFL